MVTAVVFDVGETLLDDSREWGVWADWIGGGAGGDRGQVAGAAALVSRVEIG